jgi:hypothetical protein
MLRSPELPCESTLTTNGSGQQGLSPHAIRSSQPASSAAPQRVTHRGEFDKFGVDFVKLHPRAGLQPCISPLAGAKAADLQQVRGLVQRETQPLCCIDHPQHRDCGGLIRAVTTERSIRLMQQTRRS